MAIIQLSSCTVGATGGFYLRTQKLKIQSFPEEKCSWDQIPEAVLTWCCTAVSSVLHKFSLINITGTCSGWKVSLGKGSWDTGIILS